MKTFIACLLMLPAILVMASGVIMFLHSPGVGESMCLATLFTVGIFLLLSKA